MMPTRTHQRAWAPGLAMVMTMGMALGAASAQAQGSAPAAAPAAKQAAPGGRIANPLHAYTAFGTGASEPWRAVVDAGKLNIEGQHLATQTVVVKGMAQNDGALFTGKIGTKVVRFYVRTQTCEDDNGQNTGYAATLSIGKQVLRGCAVAGAQAHAPT